MCCSFNVPYSHTRPGPLSCISFTHHSTGKSPVYLLHLNLNCMMQQYDVVSIYRFLIRQLAERVQRHCVSAESGSTGYPNMVKLHEINAWGRGKGAKMAACI